MCAAVNRKSRSSAICRRQLHAENIVACCSIQLAAGPTLRELELLNGPDLSERTSERRRHTSPPVMTSMPSISCSTIAACMARKSWASTKSAEASCPSATNLSKASYHRGTLPSSPASPSRRQPVGCNFMKPASLLKRVIRTVESIPMTKQTPAATIRGDRAAHAVRRYARNVLRLPGRYRRARRGIGERLSCLVHWRIRARSRRATRQRIRDPGGYVITMDKAAGDIPVGHVHVRNGAIVERLRPPSGRWTPRRLTPRTSGYAGIYRDAFALLERAAEEHAPARHRVFPLKEAFGRPHADRLLPGRAAVHDRRFECRTSPLSSTTLTTPSRQRMFDPEIPRHDGKWIARPLCLQRTRSVSQRQDDRLRRRAPRQAHVFLATGQPDRSWLRAAGSSTPLACRPLRPIREEFRFAVDNGLPIILHAGSRPGVMNPAKLHAEGFGKNMIFVHSLMFDQKDREVMERLDVELVLARQ